jgi:hypothetical protein
MGLRVATDVRPNQKKLNASKRGIFWGFVVSGLVAIVAINSGAPKLEKLNSEAQADRLVQYQMSASRGEHHNLFS